MTKSDFFRKWNPVKNAPAQLAKSIEREFFKDLEALVTTVLASNYTPNDTKPMGEY